MFMNTGIETKKCTICSGGFEITDEDKKFYETLSPTFNGQKYPIPSPSLCPHCRQRRRLSHRNERTLYKRKCSLSGRDIVCIYSPNVTFPVYDHKAFFSEAWDPLNYGKDLDFTKSFFENYKLLADVAPHIMNYSMDNENSDYGNLSSWNKNCYLCFESDSNDSCFYCEYTFRSKNVHDCSYSTTNSECYSCCDIRNCYNLLFSLNCHNTKNSYFLDNCENCEFCFMSSNLVGKKYLFENIELSQEEYEKKISQLDFSSHKKIQLLSEQFQKMKTLSLQKYIH